MSPSYDPTRPEVRRDPYPHYRELRESAPLQYIESTGFHTVARMADVREVLRDTAAFSSRAMRFTRSNGRAAGPMLGGDLPPEQVARLIASMPFPPQEMIGARSVIGGNVWLTESVPPDTKVFLKTPELIFKASRSGSR